MILEEYWNLFQDPESWKEERRVCYVKARIKGQKRRSCSLRCAKLHVSWLLNIPCKKRPSRVLVATEKRQWKEGRKLRSNQEIIRGATRVAKKFRVFDPALSRGALNEELKYLESRWQSDRILSFFLFYI